MKTKRKITNNNRTRKNNKEYDYSLKILNENYPLYASKKEYGANILEYTKGQEKRYHNSCLFNNMSWFGDYEEAKSYKTKDTNIYKWQIKKPTKLLNMNNKNTLFFENLFKKSKIKLDTGVNLKHSELKNIKNKLINTDIVCPYIDMTTNERAHYEFKFAYGYISAYEQYEFMRLIKFLIENDYIKIETREGKSIVSKLIQKIEYYYLFGKINNTKHNRLSIYLFDKYALNNLCKLLKKKYKIDGVFQPNMNSFWFPNLIVYKMNIKEYVLFNPHHNLNYVGIVE
jgi:hypothetical protein